MTNKITSYQKLKLEIKKLESEKYELRKMIARGDKESMLSIKKLFEFEEATEKSWWFGDTRKIGGGSGILSQMKKTK